VTSLPPDVHATLAQLLERAAEAARTGDTETARETAATAATVTENKVPPGDLRDRLQHGLAEVEPLVADEPLVAAEYLRLLAETVEETEVS
jgi:hypothetical protein